MEHMWYNFKKIKDRQRGQLDLPFEFDNDGYTIETKVVPEVSKKLNKKQKITIKQPKLF